MDAHTYLICSGHSRGEAVQLESIRGIGNAYELMTRLAAESPGSYFILCSKTNKVCGSIDTTLRGYRRRDFSSFPF